MSRRPRIPQTSRYPGRLSKHVIIAIGDLAKLHDGLGQITPLGGVPHRGAVKGAVEQLILGGHAPAYRTKFD
jgi:hypothetical protein